MSRGGPAAELPTLVAMLRWRAAERPDALAFTFLVDGDRQTETITYAELDRAARGIAVGLERVGARDRTAVLLYSPGLEYIRAFFGCLYAGAIAVPASPPDLRIRRTLPRLEGIVADSGADLVLTSVSRRASLGGAVGGVPLERWIATDARGDAPDAADQWRDPGLEPEALAFLQYTSGSTSAPRGVVLSHRNILANQAALRRALDHHEGLVSVGWQPLYHDLGLIGNVLHALYLGGHTILMSPLKFLQRPALWLDAMTRYQAHTSGAPGFGYDHCVRRIDEAERSRFDLRHWRNAFISAEPIRPATLERFVDAFGPVGFARAAFYPCYGLAESTLLVAGVHRDEGPRVLALDADALRRGHAVERTDDVAADGAAAVHRIASSGRWAADVRVEIVDPATRRRCADGDVGEVWVAGPSVARGYWRNPDATAAVFNVRLADGDAQGFLRTGDLGFVRDGEVFITGRRKDVLIVQGANYYPQDIEQSAEASYPALRAGGGVAFALEVDGREAVFVVQEFDRRHVPDRRRTGDRAAHDPRRSGHERRQMIPAGVLEPYVIAAEPPTQPPPRSPDPMDAIEAIRGAVAAEHGLRLHAVVLVKPGSVPKTSSGKLERSTCKKAFVDGALEVLAGWSTSDLPPDEDAWLHRIAWREQPAPAADAPGAARGAWLVLADRGPLGAALARALEARDERVTVFAAAPPDGDAAVRRALHAAAGADHVVDLRALDARADVADVADVAQRVRDLMADGRADPPRMVLVTRAAQPVDAGACSPAAAGVAALAQVLPFEHPQLRVRAVDLDGGGDPTDPDLEAAWLAGELLADGAEDRVARRGERRLVPRLARYSRSGKARVSVAPVVHAHATYVVTGGTGTLGLALANWLLERGARHLVLVARRPPDAATHRALSATGADVVFAPLDVAQPAEVDALFARVAAEMPPLRGVFHAARQADATPLRDLDAAQLARITAPRIEGAWNLHRATAGTALDFFVLFASTAAVTGSPGATVDAVGSFVLDALAHHRRALGLPALSIDGGPWHDGARGRSPAAGSRVLEALLRADATQVVVVPEAIEDFAAGGTARPIFDEVLRAVPATRETRRTSERPRDREFVAPRDDRERLIAGYWREALAVDEVSVEDSFYQVGGDSMLGSQVVARINRTFGVDLVLEDAFRHFTVAKLAERVEHALLARLDALSDEQVAALVGAQDDSPPAK